MFKTAKKYFLHFGRTFLVSFGALLVAAAVFYVGYTFGKKTPSTIVVHGVTNIGDPDVSADFKIFWEVWNKLKSEHIDGAKLVDQDLMYGAVTGLVNSVGDPHTIFLKPTVSQKFEEDLRGVFGGIGAEIGIKEDQLVIIAPLKDSPAEAAGIKAGDQILKIGDTATHALAVDEAVTKIRGPVDTNVTLTLFRTGWKDPKDFTIKRQVIHIPTLAWKDAGSGVVQFQLYNFNQNAPQELTRVAGTAALNPPKGIILDLRNDPGGFLDVAITVAGWFVDRGAVVTKEEFRLGEHQQFTANGNAAFAHVPMVILINEGSASASEILAGALRDDRNIQLVGKKSYGKGSVQDLQTLSDGSKLKLTIAHWLTPKGTLIDKVGLKPDIEVDLTADDVAKGKDPQLDAARVALDKLIAGTRISNESTTH